MDKSLQDKIKDLKQISSQAKFNTEKSIKTSTAGRVEADVTKFQKFLYQFFYGFIWIFNVILKPIFFKFLYPLGLYISLGYIWLWNKFVYKKDQYNIPVFSQINAGVMILFTVLFVLVSPFLLQGFFDAGIYTFTAKRDEKLLLFGSQEVNAVTGDHNVEGCPDNKNYEKRGCSDTETVYFRTRFSLFNELWSLWYKHELYWPEYVGSAVPYTTSACVADSYGVRLKLIMKDIEIYPTLLAVTCRPIEREK